MSLGQRKRNFRELINHHRDNIAESNTNAVSKDEGLQENKRKVILDKIAKEDEDKIAKLEDGYRRLKEINNEIFNKEDERDTLMEDLDKMKEEITHLRVLRLKKNKKALTDVLQFTKSELEELNKLKGRFYPSDPRSSFSKSTIAYESILAAAPSRLRYSPREAKLKLSDHMQCFLRSVISDEKISMVGVSTLFRIDNGLRYKFSPCDLAIKKNGIFFGIKKLLIDFDLVVNGWKQCLAAYVCKDVVSIIVGYLHGDFQFCAKKNKLLPSLYLGNTSTLRTIVIYTLNRKRTIENVNVPNTATIHILRVFVAPSMCCVVSNCCCV